MGCASLYEYIEQRFREFKLSFVLIRTTLKPIDFMGRSQETAAKLALIILGKYTRYVEGITGILCKHHFERIFILSLFAFWYHFYKIAYYIYLLLWYIYYDIFIYYYGT